MTDEAPKNPVSGSAEAGTGVSAELLQQMQQSQEPDPIEKVYHLLYEFTDLAKTGRENRPSSTYDELIKAGKREGPLQTEQTEELEPPIQTASGPVLRRRLGGHFVPQAKKRIQPDAKKTVAAGIETGKRKEKLRAEIKKVTGIINPEADPEDRVRSQLGERFVKELRQEIICAAVSRITEERLLHIEELRWEIADLRRTQVTGKTGAVVGYHQRLIEQYEKELQEEEELIARMSEEESIGPRIMRFIELRKYQEAWKNRRLIEVPSVAKTITRVLENMRNHQPYMLAGHLGSGKTEIAKQTAKLFMLEHAEDYIPNASELSEEELYSRLEPEFFSGSDEASVYDLVGKLKLVGKKVDDSAVVAVQAKRLATELAEKGIRDVPESDLVKLILGQGSVTETVFNYGPLGRAIKFGKPLIVDEINMIPQDVVAVMNDYLLRKVGDKVRLQQNGEEEFEIKDGFAVISTLNVGAQYAGVKDFNAAFRSRWVGEEVDYPTIGETYDLILTALLRSDVQRLPPNFPAEMYPKLVDLALVVRESQELFTGKTQGQRFMNKVSGMNAANAQLEKIVISTRDLMVKIIKPWLMGGFTKPSLDEIIAEKILQGGFDAPDDQKFLTELFLRRGFFQGWDAARFAQYGVKVIDDKEIQILQTTETRAEFEAGDPFKDLAAAARKRVMFDEQTRLLRGNAGLVKQAIGE